MLIGQLFIGDGHIDGLELPLCQKGPGLFLGGQGAQLVAVPAEQLMDRLGVCLLYTSAKCRQVAWAIGREM